MGYLGMATAQSGSQAVAVSYLRRALALSGTEAAIHNNLGNALVALRRPGEAIVSFRRAIALAPSFAAPLLSEADLEPQANRRLIRLLRSVRCDPASVRGLVGLVATSDNLGRVDEARRWARRATAIGPDQAIAHLARADHHMVANDAEAAIGHARRALAIGNDLAPALYRLGSAKERIGALDDAESHYRRALAVAPDFGASHINLGSLDFAAGFPVAALTAYGRATAIEGPGSEAEGNRLFALPFLEQSDPQALIRENRRWATTALRGVKSAASPLPTRRDSGRLRVGYVSQEFVKHASHLHLLPMLDHHDRSRFEIIGYAQMAREDRSTAEVRCRCDGWRNIADLSLDEQAATIRADDVDVLVNLTGYVATQRALFLRRIAPVQIAYMNHVGTTGMPTIDGRLTDRWLEPEGAPFLDRSERLLRLETGYVCYQPPSAPAVEELPALQRSHVTFGVFNNLAKVSDAALAAWAGILRRVPQSRILIKSQGLSSSRARSRILAAFAQGGVEAGRVELVGRIEGELANLATIARADIALDPFPFNGGMSTVETLWLGVPVVSLAGPSFVHRIGLTFLTRAGFPQWVASSVDDYADVAVALASDLSGLAALRREMRGRLQGSMLFDAASHAREVESVYRTLLKERTGQNR